MSISTHMFLFLSACCLVSLVSSIAIDNSVVGEPSVRCLRNSIVVTFATRNAFTGRIYAKGRYDTPPCYFDANRSRMRTNNPALTLEYSDNNQCNVQRQRETSGIIFTATVVISFHSMFVTKVDRAYRIACRFQQMGGVVSQRIEVAMLGTSTYNPPPQEPQCIYLIINSDANYGATGTRVRYAQIGQKVTHRWLCDEQQSSEAHCMTVHSCTIFDEQNKRVPIIDRAGCTMDKFVLPTPRLVGAGQYESEAHVFKFADRPAVRFSCAIELTPRLDRAPCRAPVCATSPPAPRVTPISGVYIGGEVNTSILRFPRAAAVIRLNRRSSSPAPDASARTMTLDLDNELSVLDLDTDPSLAYDELRRLIRFTARDDATTGGFAPARSQATAYCITPALYAALVIAAVLLFVIVCAVGGIVVYRRSDAVMLKAKVLPVTGNY